ncbi:MAG: DUF1282 family protein [Pseudomonadales bacterium]|nr:DUF1282 family protein [Pseudomonadales bacterium]
MLSNPLGFLFFPHKQWEIVSDAATDKFNAALPYPIIFALVPALAWYYGTTQIGWTVADGNVVRLTTDSALKIVIAFYLAMIFAIIAIGYSIHWMSETYGTASSIAKGITISGYTATPMFIAGILGVYPLLWLDMILGTIAVCWAVYLLFIGVPIVLKIPEERGFLYSSAIISVCLVVLIVLMGFTVILWDNGFMPVFID